MPQPGDATMTWESGLMEVLAAEAMDRSTFLGMPWISALSASVTLKPPKNPPAGQFFLYTPLIDANGHLIYVDGFQNTLDSAPLPGYLMVTGSINWFDGGGSSPHDHYANEFLAHTQAALKSGPEGTVLNAASFDEAAETFYNLWNWLNHAQDQVKSQLDQVGSDSSKFKGQAAGALLRTLENLHDEFSLLQKDLKTNQDWTQMLHDNASHIRQFWQEIRNAWDDFYSKPEPTEMVTNAVNQLVNQARSVRLTDIHTWNVRLDVGDGTTRDFNILEWGAFGKLNTDMQTVWLNNAHVLDSRMQSSYGSLRDSLDWTRTNMSDPHDYLPPPGEGVTTPKPDDSKSNLDDSVKSLGGGNGNIPNLSGGGNVPDLSGGSGGGTNQPNLSGGGGGGLPDIAGGNAQAGPGGGQLDLSGGTGLDGLNGGGNVPALGGNDPAGGGLGPDGLPLLTTGAGNSNRRTGTGSSTPTVPDPADFTGGGEASGTGDPQPSTIDPSALGAGSTGFGSMPGLGGNDPVGTVNAPATADSNQGATIPPGGGGTNTGFTSTPAGGSNNGFSVAPDGGSSGFDQLPAGPGGDDPNGFLAAPDGGGANVPAGASGGSGFDLGSSHPLTPGSSNGFQLPASDLSGGGGGFDAGGDSAWNPAAPPADSGFSFDPLGGGSGGGGAVGAPAGGSGDSRAGALFGGLAPGGAPLGGLTDVVGAAGTAGSAGAAGSTNGLGGTPPFMPPMGGMGGNGQEKERERTTWLAEEEEVWGTDPDVTPAVIGRDEADAEEQEDPRTPWMPTTRPPTRTPARDERRTTGRRY
ncbi:hypothetical protein ACIA5C_45020 [Actinoplanes sp. NPDC051343]|uniref:hypothetical protein n=1 Tax=Actinoplanes sp. NPDC051343 TaxID=3363906 RepID=UPI0037A43B13